MSQESYSGASWIVELADEFVAEFMALDMKELRFIAAGQVWRVAFAFDPRRRAILLCAGRKSGKSQGRFYRALIRKADQRFETHLQRNT